MNIYERIGEASIKGDGIFGVIEKRIKTLLNVAGIESELLSRKNINEISREIERLGITFKSAKVYNGNKNKTTYVVTNKNGFVGTFYVFTEYSFKWDEIGEGTFGGMCVSAIEWEEKE